MYTVSSVQQQCRLEFVTGGVVAPTIPTTPTTFYPTTRSTTLCHPITPIMVSPLPLLPIPLLPPLSEWYTKKHTNSGHQHPAQQHSRQQRHHPYTRQQRQHNQTQRTKEKRNNNETYWADGLISVPLLGACFSSVHLSQRTPGEVAV